MGRRIMLLLLLVLLAAGGYYVYQRNKAGQDLAGGETHCVGCMTAGEKERFDRENAGESPDGQSERKNRTVRQETIQGSSDNKGTTANQPPVQDRVADGKFSGASVANNGAPEQTPDARMQTADVRLQATPVMGAPASDSLTPNAPNGMTFGGKGNYQWYRQGNLTWRVDTVSGSSCIVYATMEEWRKQIVYSHGCGRNA